MLPIVNRSLLLASAAIALAGCQGDAAAPITPAADAAAHGAPTLSRAQWLARTATAGRVDAFVARYPAEQAAKYRKVLESNNEMLVLDGDSVGNQMLREIYATRIAAMRATEVAPAYVSATIAMVDSLPIAHAVALVTRRHGRTPQDVILVRAEHLTPGTLRAAIRTLYTIRRQQGDSGGGDFDAPVFLTGAGNERLRTQKQRSAHEGAVEDIARLRDAPRTTIDGVGSVRAISIALRPTR